MDRWEKGLLNNKILLVKNYISNTYAPSPHLRPVRNDEATDNYPDLFYEIHQNDPYSNSAYIDFLSDETK